MSVAARRHHRQRRRARAISAERFRQGSSAVGRVLTLVIVADEATQADAIAPRPRRPGSTPAGSSRRSRARARARPRLDAEITVGGADGLGELAVLRLRGPLAHHAGVGGPAAAACPTPRSWSGGRAPRPTTSPADPVGRLAQRRITDAAGVDPPGARAASRARAATPPATPTWPGPASRRGAPCWPSALDQPFERDHRARASSAQRSNPSGLLLASWLQHVPRRAGRRARQPRARASPGSRSHTEGGDISITRPDGRVARMVASRLPGPRGGAAAAHASRASSPRSCAASTPTRSTARPWRPSPSCGVAGARGPRRRPRGLACEGRSAARRRAKPARGAQRGAAAT